MDTLVIERFVQGGRNYDIGDIVTPDDMDEHAMQVLVQRARLINIDPLIKHLAKRLEIKSPAKV